MPSVLADRGESVLQLPQSGKWSSLDILCPLFLQTITDVAVAKGDASLWSGLGMESVVGLEVHPNIWGLVSTNICCSALLAATSLAVLSFHHTTQAPHTAATPVAGHLSLHPHCASCMCYASLNSVLVCTFVCNVVQCTTLDCAC